MPGTQTCGSPFEKLQGYNSCMTVPEVYLVYILTAAATSAFF